MSRPVSRMKDASAAAKYIETVPLSPLRFATAFHPADAASPHTLRRSGAPSPAPPAQHLARLAAVRFRPFALPLELGRVIPGKLEGTDKFGRFHRQGGHGSPRFRHPVPKPPERKGGRRVGSFRDHGPDQEP